MIKLLQEGHYSLIETKNQTKILSLDDSKTFAWVNVENIGQILVASYTEHTTDHVLALGKYRLYEVKDETNLTDLMHLELLVGEGKWQGYLLLTGLPSEEDIRNRIIPTQEIISKTKQ